jgi:hypothetical protein
MGPCEDCAYSARWKNEHEIRECRREGPSFERKDINNPWAIWPLVLVTDFCGQFLLSERTKKETTE